MKISVDFNPFSLTQGIMVYNENIENGIVEYDMVANDKVIETIKNLGMKYQVQDYTFHGSIDYCAKFKSDLLKEFILTDYTNVNITIVDN